MSNACCFPTNLRLKEGLTKLCHVFYMESMFSTSMRTNWDEYVWHNSQAFALCTLFNANIQWRYTYLLCEYVPAWHNEQMLKPLQIIWWQLLTYLVPNIHHTINYENLNQQNDYKQRYLKSFIKIENINT